MRNKYLILLFIIVLIAGFLRIYKITENPISLNGDEISFGYAAYSIVQTGRDENNAFMPLSFKSIGDYKNPLPVYLMAIPISILGLSDFSVRLPNALFGTLTVLFYFFFLNYLLKNKSLSLLGSFLLAISSWHILYSRYAYEGITACFFILAGIFSFLKMLEGGVRWSIISAFFLILTMYTSFAPRLFIPLFVITALIINFKNIERLRKNIIVFFGTCVLLALPLLYVTLYQGAGTRFSMVFILNDVDFKRYAALTELPGIGEVPLLILFWIKRLLNYLQPEFIFFNGLNMTIPGTIGLGLLYFYEIPFLLLGFIEFIKRKIPFKPILVAWIVAGIIPDSLTNNQQHAGRLIHIVPVLVLIITLGANSFFRLIKNLRNPVRYLFLLGFIFFIVLNLIHAYLTFSVHFPRHRGESFDEGIKEAVFYIMENEDKYKEIVFDIRRGVEGPYLIANPQMYLLFYSKYDPSVYQSEPKLFGTQEKPFYKFNKYTFRVIDWHDDGDKKDTLFIGSPWSFPEVLKEGELLKKIMMKSGHPAYYIVDPVN